MNPSPHRLAMADFVALAAGGGGVRAVRALVAARRSRTLQLIRLIVGSVGEGDPVTRHAYRALGKVHRTAPAAVDQILAHPAVGAWATRTARRVGGSEPVATDFLVGAAVAAAVRGRVPITVYVPEGRDLPLPSLGVVADVPRGRLVVVPAGDGTEINDSVRIPPDPSRGAAGWHPNPEVVLHGNGPLARFQLDRWSSYPMSVDLAVAADVDVRGWRTMLADAWTLLVRYHPELAEELAAAITVLTPLAESPAGSASATVEDAFGCVLLSLGPDAETMAVSLAHELRHNMLIALLDLFPLVDQVAGETFYAPWREDPRPLLGLLHGTYAYLGVSAFWRRQRFHQPTGEAEFFAHTEFARWRSNALAATGTLAGSGRLTTAGQTFVTVMAETLRSWCAESVPPAASDAAARLSADHRDTWRSRNRSG